MSSQKAKEFTCMLLDLDDTLYRVHQIPSLVKDNILDYMKNVLLIPDSEIQALNQELYVTYGTTMAGLVAKGYKINFDDWHEKVHLSLPYHDLLRPDPALRKILTSIRLPKFVLTNADKRHAKICLEILGIQDLFQGVIAFENLNEAAAKRGWLTSERPVLCKPDKRAYELALEMIGADKDSTIFFDDSVRNVSSAHHFGLHSVLVGSDAHVVAGADVVIPDMYHLPAALPDLFLDSHLHEVEQDHTVAITVKA